jgi:hypothetical protein
MRRATGLLVFGLMMCSGSLAAATRPGADEPREAAASAPVAVQRVSVSGFHVRDEAAMVLVGTALIGLAAAVRRAA